MYAVFAGWVSTRWNKVTSQWPYLLRTLRLVWDAAPAQSVTWALLLVSQAPLPALTVWLARQLVNRLSAQASLPVDWRAAGDILWLGGGVAALMIAGEVLRAATTWVRVAQSERVKDHIAERIQTRSLAVDLSFYDSADYYDQLHRAREEASYRPSALLESIGNLLRDGLGLVGLAAILIPFGLWLPVVLFLSALPGFVLALRHYGREHRWRMQVTPLQRRAYYYDWVMTSRNAAAELRLFGLGPHFRALYRLLQGRIREERLTLVRSQGIAGLAGAALGLLIGGAALAWMIWRVLQGTATLGDLVLLFEAFRQGQLMLRGALQSVGQLYANSLFLSNLFAFFDLQPEIADPPVPRAFAFQHALEFRDLVFRYPGTDREALNGLSLRVPAGQTVAVVGENGSGKSTLLKLLCRLYDPDAGHITVDGIDLRSFSLDSLRRQVAVLFQEPVHYSDSVWDNIAYGDLYQDSCQELIEQAARAAGGHAFIAQLPEGYRTMLGRLFSGGSELSFGQWQRVALARGFYADAAIVALDEPTSAMDSWAEADWLACLRQHLAGRTAIIVTHRFTTAMVADVIHVMAHGRIVESGSHAELLSHDGPYARSWCQQMQRAAPPA